MNRRVASVLIALLVSPIPVFAQDTFEEGEHYKVVPVPFEDQPKGLPIVVTEVFSYACIHCYDFEAHLEPWIHEQDPDRVKFERIHVVFSASMVNLARAYLTSEALEVTDAIHQKFFEAIHKHGLNMNQEDLLRRLFKSSAEVENAQFDEIFSSTEISQLMRTNNGKTRVWRIMGTPTMVVDGRYTVSPTPLGSHKKVLEVVDFLVQKVIEERNSST